ncbi:50S ribosomal protein L30 [Oceanidesulfovibrio marinus]|uniref:50S ribosomal protein L30 n=1 Tax=Oceanidesulfovibrio marinus TaxID=370038 RepID=A0A6P1ZDA6_9BACT|nr:50S ribosomal protein L30 [Oceanidesulfovibrio marinus]QJT07667.1 50S ribosomal protein L30 [Oceanidesulfovibrio marinus]TVM32023.1 50S ribosomal protein L30 [Oceanidesulfovibrio marinus]
MPTVTLKKSLIGCNPTQRRTLAAMGLRKIRQEKTLPDNKSTWGMIETVKHLVEVKES